ncbi:MAG: hypothetical protein M1820_002719 [Bogoriella megaspora]|nr:MAG: hypothetical protein M1820_002719 [Bogoriella megaspora]
MDQSTSRKKRRRYEDDASQSKKPMRRRYSSASEKSDRQASPKEAKGRGRSNSPEPHRRSRSRNLGRENHGRRRSPNQEEDGRSGKYRLHRRRSRSDSDSGPERRRARSRSFEDSRKEKYGNGLKSRNRSFNRNSRSPRNRRDNKDRERDRSRSSSSSSRSRSPRVRRSEKHRKRDRGRDRGYERERHQRQRSGSPRIDRRDRSPKHKRDLERRRSPAVRSRGALPSQDDSFHALTKTGMTPPPNDKPVPKEKPNYGNTGLLARETNIVAGTDIVLKYNEPSEARKPPPSQAWRMFVFKGKDVLETVELGARSVWLLGRESKVVDLVTAHPSCSGQHAVIQFRHTTKTGKNGEPRQSVRPYLLDLESANGTILNDGRIEARRYVELRSGDLIKLGSSEREYVVLLPPKDS